MKNQEIGLPQMAGGVTMSWDEGTIGRFWSRDQINIPQSIIRSVHQLAGGRNLLIKISASANHGRFVRWSPVIFCGDDGRPFVTMLSKRAYAAFLKGGENDFYDFLVPDAVRAHSKETNQFPIRQGDIWACWYAQSWQDAEIAIAEKYDIHSVKESGGTIFKTRHSVKGEIKTFTYVSGQRVKTRKSKRKPGKVTTKMNTITLATGLLEAPDHEPKNLSDGVYVIARTSCIVQDFRVRGTD